MSTIFKFLSIIAVFTCLNCNKQNNMDNNDLELQIKKYAAKIFEKETNIENSFYHFFKVTKLDLNEPFLKYNIYHVYTYSTPKRSVYVSYASDKNKIINLQKFKNRQPIGFSRILNFDKIDTESDIIKVITIYLELFDQNLLNQFSDIPGTKLNGKDKYDIKPPDIKWIDKVWLIELFAWSELGGVLLKHRIKIDKKNGIIDNIELIDEFVGAWTV